MNVLKYNSLFVAIFCAAAFVTLLSCEQSNRGRQATTAPVPDLDLQTAVVVGNLEVVQQHIAAGTDLNQKDPLSQSTPLMTAVVFNHQAIAKALIDGGADLHIKNGDGSTALHSAAFFCRVELVQLLLDAQADKTLRNSFGATPRETVLGDFEEVKPVYDMLQQQLAPMGLTLDYAEMQKARPVIAIILQ